MKTAKIALLCGFLVAVNGQGDFFQRGRGRGAGPRGPPPRSGFSTIRGGGPGAFNSGSGTGFREPSFGGGFSSGGGFGGSPGGSSAGGRGVEGSNNIVPTFEEPIFETSSMDGESSSLGQNGKGNGGAGGMTGGSEGRPQTVRNIYVYSTPDDPQDSQTRTIRVPGGQDKHVNIIFLKTPSQSSAQQTEVILPKQPQQQTVVYVLVKKGNNSANVMIRKPPTPAPSKPQVFFIRYKNPSTSNGNGDGSGSSSTGNGNVNSNGFGGGNSGSSGGAFGNGAGASDGGFGSSSGPKSFGTF